MFEGECFPFELVESSTEADASGYTVEPSVCVCKSTCKRKKQSRTRTRSGGRPCKSTSNFHVALSVNVGPRNENA